MNIIYSPGSVFRVTKHYSQDPMKQYETNDFHVLLAQIDYSKFILISLDTGRPWLRKPITGGNSGVRESDLSSYLKETLVDEFVLLGHSKHFDSESLTTFI